MSIVLVDGFDLYNGVGANTGLRSKWTAGQGNVVNIAMVAGRFGGQAMRVTAASTPNYRMLRSLPSSYSSMAVGVAMRFPTMPTVATTGPNVCTMSGASYMPGIRVQSDGSIVAALFTGITASTTLGASAAGVITLNTWHYVEMEIVISDTIGVFNVYVDSVPVIALSNVDTRNGTPASVDTILLGSPTGSASGGVCDFDDLYFDNAATRRGERRVETVYPTSDVAQGFGRSSGSDNYALVDEATANGDTDYVQGTTPGDVDTYGFGNLSSTPADIDAVQLSAFAMKTDAAGREIALQAISGSTTSDGANFALAGSYGKHERLMLTDPDTGSAWSASAVNALEGGPKVTV